MFMNGIPDVQIVMIQKQRMFPGILVYSGY